MADEVETGLLLGHRGAYPRDASKAPLFYPVRLLLTVLPLLAASCFLSESVVNLPLDGEAAATIVPGETTALEVVAILGAPNEVIQLTERSAWLYEHVHQ